MSIGMFFLHVGLVLVAFLVMLNGHLRGAAKAKIDGVLSVAWIGLLALGTFMFGWRQGLIALVASFVYSRASVPVAKKVAQRILGYRTTLETAGPEVDFTVEGLLRSNEADNRRLAKIAARPQIARVLDANGLGPADLREQFWFLMSSGLGDLSWEVVSAPADLTKLLEMRRQGLKPVEIVARFMAIR